LPQKYDPKLGRFLENMRKLRFVKSNNFPIQKNFKKDTLSFHEIYDLFVTSM